MLNRKLTRYFMLLLLFSVALNGFSYGSYLTDLQKVEEKGSHIIGVHGGLAGGGRWFPAIYICPSYHYGLTNDITVGIGMYNSDIIQLKSIFRLYKQNSFIPEISLAASIAKHANLFSSDAITASATLPILWNLDVLSIYFMPNIEMVNYFSTTGYSNDFHANITGGVELTFKYFDIGFQAATIYRYIDVNHDHKPFGSSNIYLEIKI